MKQNVLVMRLGVPSLHFVLPRVVPLAGPAVHTVLRHPRFDMREHGQVVRLVVAGGIVANLDALAQSTTLSKARQQSLALAPIK